MNATILQGDIFDVLPTLKPGSVDAVCTSPPYWMLRSYLDKNHPLKSKELGSEPTPEAFVENLVRVFRLVRDVLAKHGTCWVNIGDSYSSNSGSSKPSASSCLGSGPGKKSKYRDDCEYAERKSSGIPAGNLCLIPQRLALALQADGWVVRSVVVWSKPACMPQSLSGWSYRRCRVKVATKDTAHMHDGRGPNGNPMRPHSGETMRTSTEWQDCPGCKRCEKAGGYVLRKGSWRPTSSWEPILMLAKGPQYFCDQQAVLTSPAAATVQRDLYSRILDDPEEQFAVKHDHETLCAGANPRDVQVWASEPLGSVTLPDGSTADHYAAFPTKLADFCLRASTSSKGYCPACGAPWCRVVDSERGDTEAIYRPKQTAGMGSGTSTLSLSGNGSKEWVERGAKSVTLDWRPTCACPPHEPRAGLVLDPFCGSARTGFAARRLGLDFVGIELNPKSAAMSRKLLNDDFPLLPVAEDPR